MTARAALIRPWIFREQAEGYVDLDAEQRLAIYRRYATLAKEHWGADDHGLARVRQFTRWHLDFWCREVRRRDDGSFPAMQVREPSGPGRGPSSRPCSAARIQPRSTIWRIAWPSNVRFVRESASARRRAGG